jgi:hypothetical protein
VTRSQRKQRVQGIVEHYVEIYRKRLKADLAFDIRKDIDRETDTLIRGAKCAAMREVFREFKEKSQVVPQTEK